MTRATIIILKSAVSLCILVFLCQKAIKDDQFLHFANVDKNWLWLGIAITASAVAHLISFIRWRLLVRALGMPFSVQSAIRIGLIGTCFSFVAFGAVGGDALRAFYVARESKNKAFEAVASVIVDRYIGVLTMFTIAAIAFLCSDFSAFDAAYPAKLAQIRAVCIFALAVSCVGFAGLFGLLFTPGLETSPGFRIITSVPKAGPMLRRLTSEIRVYREHVSALVIAFVMSVGVHFCFAIAIFAIAAGVTEAHPTFAQHVLMAPISMVANAAPLPGGIGGMELAIDFFYRGFQDQSSQSSQSVVVAFGFRATLLLISALGAIVWFFDRDRISAVRAESVVTTD